VPVGLALDRYSRRWVLFLCVLVWSIGAGACGLAATFAALAVARALVGGGEAGFSTGAYSVVGDSFPPARVSLAMSVFVMGGIMGAGIVFLLGGPLVEAILHGAAADWPLMHYFQPWQRAFLLTGFPGVLTAILVFIFPEPARHHVATDQPGYGDALRFVAGHRRLFTAVFVGFGLIYTCTIALQLWLPSYLVRVHGWAPGRIGVLLGVAQLLAAGSLPVHGWIVDRLFRRGVRGAPGRPPPPPRQGEGGRRAGRGAAAPSASMGPAATQVVTPQHLRGRVSALYVLTSGLIAMAVGPSLVGLVTDKVLGDPRMVGTSLIIVLIVIFIPALLLFALGRTQMKELLSTRESATVE
jgi:MFS family permease